MATNSRIHSVETALRVLAEIASHDAVGVTELSKILGIPKTSVQRVLYTLQGAGWVREAGGEITRWTLTSLMFLLTQKGDWQNTLRRAALPAMEKIRLATQETVHLAIQERDTIIIIDRLESPQAVRVNLDLGQIAPLVASANGKAILSTWPRDEVEALVSRNLTQHTNSTILDPAQLLANIEEARQRGYATNAEEWREGVAAVSAPIVQGDRAESALSISTPANRMSPEKQREYGALLIDATASIDVVLPRRR